MGDRMTEAQLQSAIIDLAHALGYEKVAHFRPALMMIHGELTYRTPVAADGKGFPDLNILGKGRVIYIECKSEKGRLSPEQEEWQREIRASGAEYYLFRPSDWLNDNIDKALKQK
jgi:VRR-NUC domain